MARGIQHSTGRSAALSAARGLSRRVRSAGGVNARLRRGSEDTLVEAAGEVQERRLKVRGRGRGEVKLLVQRVAALLQAREGPRRGRHEPRVADAVLRPKFVAKHLAEGRRENSAHAPVDLGVDSDGPRLRCDAHDVRLHRGGR